MKLCNKSERRFYTKKKKNIFDIEKSKSESERICGEAVEKRVH